MTIHTQDIFLFIIKKICSIERLKQKNSNSEKEALIIRLKDEEGQIMKKYEVKNYVKEFIQIMIKELYHKLS